MVNLKIFGRHLRTLGPYNCCLSLDTFESYSVASLSSCSFILVAAVAALGCPWNRLPDCQDNRLTGKMPIHAIIPTSPSRTRHRFRFRECDTFFYKPSKLVTAIAGTFAYRDTSDMITVDRKTNPKQGTENVFDPDN